MDRRLLRRHCWKTWQWGYHRQLCQKPMNIVIVGRSSTGAVLTLENAAKTVNVQKCLDPTDAKTFLAIILTAKSQGKPVQVYVDTSLSYY
jgi:hypothetical protein